MKQKLKEMMDKGFCHQFADTCFKFKSLLFEFCTINSQLSQSHSKFHFKLKNKPNTAKSYELLHSVSTKLQS